MADSSSPEITAASPKLNALGRIRSRRSLTRQLDSSESREAEQDSIYNAEAVRSRESFRSEEQESARDAPDNDGTLSLPSSPGGLLDKPSTPHSHWPPPQLTSILEQSSIHSIRQSASLPRLSASPERKSQIVHSQQSIRSIHPQTATSPWPLRKALPSTSLDRRRSLSMNDLDRICQPVASNANPRRSSSSSNDIDRSNWCPALPNKPVQSPPYRVPTPPGLPSFGTEEANDYRLPGQHSPGRSLWNRLWRHSQDGSDEQPPISPRLLGSPLLGPQNPQMGPPSEVLKRTLAMLGMARVVSPPPPSLKHGRVPLPPGVVTANNGTGALAQADDGTYIRGRFGPRASGHGVGGRSLEAHPIARTAQLSAIEEQVREIDKACERVDAENALSQIPFNDMGCEVGTGVPFNQEPQEMGEARAAESPPPQGVSEDESLSPAIYLSPPSMSPQMHVPDSPDQGASSMQEGPYFESARLRSPPSLPHSVMGQIPGYPSSTLLYLRSMESMPGLFSAAEEAERTRVRELVLEEKRREQRKLWSQMRCAAEDCCHEVWHLWACASSCGGHRCCRRSESEF